MRLSTALRRPVVLILAVAALLAAAAGPVQAATSPSGGIYQSRQMVVIGYDPAVAAAHGYRVPAGARTITAATAPLAQPDNTVYGPCGSSWLYLTGGHHQYRVATGFTVNGTAFTFGWYVQMYGPWGYDPVWSWGHPMWGSSWALAQWFNVDSSGTYIGDVSTGSYAILIDGRVCTSVGPSSRTSVS